MDEKGYIKRADREKEEAEWRRIALEGIEKWPGEYIATCLYRRMNDVRGEIPERMKRFNTKLFSGEGLPWAYYDLIGDLFKVKWNELPRAKQERTWEIVTDIADYIRSDAGNALTRRS
jgi:hypothetical protein